MEFKIIQNDNHVATIEATDLNAVFEIGNIGPENKIERLAPMHSISVGDVIVDEDEKSFSVDPVGFSEITFFVMNHRGLKFHRLDLLQKQKH